jgi:hypothetical protein
MFFSMTCKIKYKTKECVEFWGLINFSRAQNQEFGNLGRDKVPVKLHVEEN